MSEIKNQELGHQYAKPNIERLNLLSEMRYMNSTCYSSLSVKLMEKNAGTSLEKLQNQNWIDGLLF